MIKLMFLMKRRPGMTRAEFRDYYEERHAPFMQSVVGSPAGYRRNYIVEPTDGDYDAITEILYETADDLAVAQAAMAANADAIRKDEERFVDRSSVRSYIVECVS